MIRRSVWRRWSDALCHGRVYLNLTATRGGVQFWLRPGDDVVELSFSGGREASTPTVLEEMF